MIPFDSSIDKITERELAFDIVERLKLGRNIETGQTTYNTAGQPLINILKNLISIVPNEAASDFSKAKCEILRISAGDNTGSIIINGLTEQRVIAAISEQTNIDIKDCVTVITSDSDTIICTVIADSAYSNDEAIKIYAI